MSDYQMIVQGASDQLHAILGYRTDSIDVGIGVLAKEIARLRAEVERLKGERDNARAEASWLGRLLTKTRNAFGYIVREFEDEGDRVYFGSSNHADELRDIEDEMLRWEESRIMAATRWEDHIGKAAATVSRYEAALRAIRDCATPEVEDAGFQRRARYDLQEIARAALEKKD